MLPQSFPDPPRTTSHAGAARLALAVMLSLGLHAAVVWTQVSPRLLPEAVDKAVVKAPSGAVTLNLPTAGNRARFEPAEPVETLVATEGTSWSLTVRAPSPPEAQTKPEQEQEQDQEPEPRERPPAPEPAVKPSPPADSQAETQAPKSEPAQAQEPPAQYAQLPDYLQMAESPRAQDKQAEPTTAAAPDSPVQVDLTDPAGLASRLQAQKARRYSLPGDIGVPSPEPGLDAAAIRALYRELLADALAADFSYPRQALRRRLEGETLVRFEITPQGAIANARVAQSSRYGVLDQAAKALVASLNDLPGYAELNAGPIDSALSFTLPVRYEMR